LRSAQSSQPSAVIKAPPTLPPPQVKFSGFTPALDLVGVAPFRQVMAVVNDDPQAEPSLV
jgi:hypothetical protein